MHIYCIKYIHMHLWQAKVNQCNQYLLNKYYLGLLYIVLAL